MKFDPLNFLAMINQNTFISRFNVSPHKFDGNFDNYSKGSELSSKMFKILRDLESDAGGGVITGT